MPTKFQFNRGVEANRSGETPAAGEPLWTTDTKVLYIGDGSTAGGIRVSMYDWKAGTEADFHSLGIDDNATATRLNLADADITMGGSGQVNYDILKVDSTGRLGIFGGPANTSHAGILLYGLSHGTKFNDIEFMSANAVVGHYDSSGNEWDFQNKTIRTGAALVLDFANLGIRREVNTEYLEITGSNAANSGGNIRLFGSNHASQPGDITFRSGSNLEAHYNDTISEWDFQANNIVTTGALNASMDSVFHTTDIATTDPLVEVIRGTTTAFTYDSAYSIALASKEAFVGMAFLQDKVTTPPDTNIAFGSSTNNWKAGITYDNDADLVNIWAGMDFVISGYDAGSWTQPRAYAGHWLGANVEGQAATESLRLDAVLYPLHVFGDGVGFSTMARFEQDSGLANAYVEVIADDNQWAGFTMKSQGGGNGGGVFYGGGTNGDKIQLYCDGGWINIHSALSATPRDLEFITSIGTELHYDDSASEWDFQANAITTTGSVTCGDFTSTGIDDTATTGERLQLADTLLTLGQSGASGYNIARVSETGALLVSGGASGSTGSNIRLFGNAHSSSAYDFDFRSDTTVEMKFDYNLNQWEFKANDVLLNSGDLIIGTIGKGIDFSATADGSGTTDNEILDDYEEGTWTPTITDGTNNATLSLATGSYTKVGDIVTLRGRLTLSSKGSISGNLRLGGFPFSCQPNVAASMSTLHIGYCVGATITAGQSMAGYISNNNSYAFLRLWDATGGQTALQDTEVGNSLSLIFTALYTNDV